MPCQPDWRESYVIRLWAEPDRDRFILRGFIQDTKTGNKTYFHNLDLPVGLLRESAHHLALPDQSLPLR